MKIRTILKTASPKRKKNKFICLPPPQMMRRLFFDMSESFDLPVRPAYRIMVRQVILVI